MKAVHRYSIKKDIFPDLFRIFIGYPKKTLHKNLDKTNCYMYIPEIRCNGTVKFIGLQMESERNTAEDQYCERDERIMRIFHTLQFNFPAEASYR